MLNIFNIFTKSKTTEDPVNNFRMRFIASDMEYQISWNEEYDNERADQTIYFGLRYLMKEIGSNLNIEKLRITDNKGKRTTLVDIAKNRSEVVFVLSDHVKGVRTYTSLAPRSIQNTIHYGKEMFETSIYSFA